MLPEEMLSPETKYLATGQEECSDEIEVTSPPPPRAPEDCCKAQPSQTKEMPAHSIRSRPKELPFQPGDLLYAEFQKGENIFKKLFKLEAAGQLSCNWGAIPYKEMIGKLPGQLFRSSIGHRFMLRRPALEEFVFIDEKGAYYIISEGYEYDADDDECQTRRYHFGCWLRIWRNEFVFIASSWIQGQVKSFEIRKDHHNQAKKNYKCWRDAWKISHIEEWPDNVDFIHKDILKAAEDIESITFDGVALDMLNPQIALPIVYPNLKQGGICAVYLANITQVIELLEGIRTCKLAFWCEQIREVLLRDWLICPAKRKDGTLAQRVEAKTNMDLKLHSQREIDTEESENAQEKEMMNHLLVFHIAQFPTLLDPFIHKLITQLFLSN